MDEKKALKIYVQLKNYSHEPLDLQADDLHFSLLAAYADTPLQTVWTQIRSVSPDLDPNH